VAVTNRCRYNCWHCSKHHRPQAELPPEALARLAADLQEMGVSIIGLTGGEPLLRGDLESLLRGIDDRSTCLLFTSGDGLTPERAASLKDAGLFGAAVSLDHVDAAVHDKLRGHSGAYDTALAAIRATRDAGLYTMIQLVATREMVGGNLLDRYLELAAGLGVHEIRLLEPMPTGRLMQGQARYGLSARERRLLRDVHVRTNRDPRLVKVSSFAHVEHGSNYGCGAGFQHLYVDADGNVCPCDFVPVSFGNVNEEPVGEIWSRMNRAFGRPRRCCFLLEHAAQLNDAFTGTLPIPYAEARKCCCFEHKGKIPDYYRAIGMPAGHGPPPLGRRGRLSLSASTA
jgi:MoaA/NifB/PqqE/SkfB family radical SAM enzyme